MGHLFTDDLATSVLIETVLAVVLVLAHRRYNRVLFARSWSIWLYALPVVLAIALPFHYELILPVFLYMVYDRLGVLAGLPHIRASCRATSVNAYRHGA